MKTNYLKPLLVINSVCLFAGMAGAADAPSLPAPTAPAALPPLASSAWRVKISGDYFSFSSKESSYLPRGGGVYDLFSSKRQGDLYGGTVGIKLPSWENSVLDFSYRHGKMTGTEATSQLKTTVDELALTYRWSPPKFLRWKSSSGDPIGNLTTAVGFTYDKYDKADTFYSEKANNYQINLGVGYNLKWFQIGDGIVFRMGNRLDILGGVGIANTQSSLYDNTFNKFLGTLAGRGTVYSDLVLRNGMTIFAEGGYQYTRDFYVWKTTFTRTGNTYNTYANEARYGLFARAGITFEF
ncbi:MAG: hypothetical protein WCO56_08345 [Verrucomicrobiota bacterium]